MIQRGRESFFDAGGSGSVTQRTAGSTSKMTPVPFAGRLAILDVARLVAAVAVIWIHTPRSPELSASRELGRFAVPFFIATAVFFAWQSARRHAEVTVLGYARTR